MGRHMRVSSGSGGVSGISSDNAGGAIIAGALKAGGLVTGLIEYIHQFVGRSVFDQNAPSLANNDTTVEIDQSVAPVTHTTSRALLIYRSVAANSGAGGAWSAPTVSIVDTSGAGQPILTIGDTLNAHNTSFYPDGTINSGRGFGVYGQGAPFNQPLLATGASHTVDDVITLLQLFGFCKQA